MNRFLWLLVLVIIILNACSGKKSYNKNASQTQQDTLQIIRPDSLRITDYLKENQGYLELDLRESIIFHDKLRQRIIGQIDLKQGSIYINDKGDVIAKIKYLDDGFEIQNTNKDILWKVLYKYKDEIRVADNKSMVGAYQLINNKRGKFTVRQAEKLLGDVSYGKKSKQLIIKGSSANLRINTKKNTFAYSILLIKNIPEAYRYVLLNELLYQIPKLSHK